MTGAPAQAGVLGAPELRAALVDASVRIERRNQPRYLLVAATGLLLVALVWLVVALREKANAQEALTAETGRYLEVSQLTSELLALKQAETDALGDEGVKKNPAIAGRIEAAAKTAGLVGITIAQANDQRAVAPTGLPGGAGKSRLHRTKFAASNFVPQELGPLFTWIETALRENKGLELNTVSLMPGTATVDGKPRWKGTVAFTRWETNN